MATFKQQVEALTSLSIGTTPTDDELSQFLVDGTKEVANRIIQIRPEDIAKFTTSTHDSNDSGITLTGKILSVVREHDSTSILRPCDPIDPSERYLATDSDSLKYRSKYNPGFYILNGKVHTVPVSAGSNNDSIVTQVSYATNQGHSSSSIDNFPDEYEYLVVMYAAIQSLQSKMSSNVLATTIVPPDVPNLATISFTESNSLNMNVTTPTAISLTTVNYSAVSATASTAVSELNPPAYSKLSSTAVSGVTSFEDFFNGSEDLNPFGDNDPGVLSITIVPPDSPTLTSVSFSDVGSDEDATLVEVSASTTLSGGASAPSYNNAITQVTNAFTDIDSALNDEDIELANARISEAQIVLQNELNEFNEANIKFQANVKESLAEFQSANQIAIGNADRSQSRQLQNSINNAKAIVDNNNNLIQEYQAGLSHYQAEVNMQVQEYSQKLSKYQLEVNTAYQAWAKTESDRLQSIQVDIQDELNEFNKENAQFEYETRKALADAQATNQVALQNGVQEAKDAIENNQASIAQYQAMSSHYSAEVNKAVQSYTSQLQADVQTMQASIANNQNLLSNYQAEISLYQSEMNAEMQESTSQMQQYQIVYNQLKQQYDQILAAPPARRQEGEDR